MKGAPLVVVGSQDGTVLALDADTGAHVWRYPMHHEVDMLLYDRDTIYVAVHASPHSDSEQPAQIISLKAHDGKLLWQKQEITLAGYTKIAVDSNILFASSSMGKGAVCAFDALTCLPAWIYPNMFGRVQMLVHAYASKVYINGIPRGFAALDGTNGRLLWSFDHGSNPALLVASDMHAYAYGMYAEGKQVVTVDISTGIHTTSLALDPQDKVLAIAKGIAYVARNGYIYALRIHDSVQIWCTPSQVLSDDQTNHLMVSNAQVCLSQHTLAYSSVELVPHKITVGAVDVQTGAVLWQWRSNDSLASASNAVGLASGHKHIYLTTEQGIFTFHERDGRLLWRAIPDIDLSFIHPVVSRDDHS